MGWEYVADTNASDSERIGFTPSTISHGVRNSAYSAFVRPVRGRRNLTVVTRTRAGYLLFDVTAWSACGPLTGRKPSSTAPARR